MKARRVTDLYKRIVRRYQGTLEALLPVIEIPVRIQNEDECGGSESVGALLRLQGGSSL